MKRTRHTPEQFIGKLREAEAMRAAGMSVAQVVQALGVSERTFNRWRRRYGGMKADEAKRLKELDFENARLKKLVTEQAIDLSILREANGCLESRIARAAEVRRVRRRKPADAGFDRVCYTPSAIRSTRCPIATRNRMTCSPSVRPRACSGCPCPPSATGIEARSSPLIATRSTATASTGAPNCSP